MPPKDTPTPGGAYIRELRNSRGWSQTKLGHAIGYARDNEVRGFERGKRDPSIRDLHNIRRVLQLTGFEWQELLRRFNILEEMPPAIQTPDPPAWFRKYRLGNIELPVMVLFGSPEHPWEMGEVTIDYKRDLYHHNSDYPAELADARKELLDRYFAEYGKDPWKNNLLPRLGGYTQFGETSENKRGELILHFTQTDFFTFLATNRSLDVPVIPPADTHSPDLTNQTIREAYVKFPYQLETSVLANPFSVHTVVISNNPNQTPNPQTLLRFRGNRVVLYQNCYQVTAAGFMVLAHLDEKRTPHPFVTAVQEAREETADILRVPPDAFKLIGVAVNWEDMDLNGYGYVETTHSVLDLLGDFRRDAYEGFLEPISFEPEAILPHIAEHRWEPESTLAMCAVLLAHFPRDRVEAIARTLPKKNFQDFFEQHEGLQKEVG